MPLLPVQSADKVQTTGVISQENLLYQPGSAQGPFHNQRRPVRILTDLHPGRSVQGYRQLLIHAAQLPGVVTGVHILEQQKPVAVPRQKFLLFSRLPDAGQLSGIIDPAGQMLIAEHISAAVSRRNAPDGSPPVSPLRPACSDHRKPLGGDLPAPEGPLPSQMVVDGHPLPWPAQHLLQQLSAPGTDHLQLQLRPLVDPGNGGARRNVVELVEQQQLPQLFQLLLPRLPDRPARQHLFRHVVFHRLQSGLRPADAPLGPGLRGQGSPVPRQIQLAAVDILNLLFLRPPEEAHRVLHMAPGRALQVPAAQGRLHHLPSGASAAVSVAEGEHEAIDALLLDPVVLPPGDQLPGREHGVVPPEQVGQHPAAVQSLPPEEVIGEGLRLRVLAGELLGGKIGDLALLHDLGQRRRKAEGIRHPGHKAVHSQLLPEPALSPDELPDEAFPGGDVGITLHPQRPLGIKSPGGGLFLHPPVDVRIKGLQILQYRRLAEQEPVVRILLHQRQLVGVGPGRLPHGLLHRPEPGQV